MLRVVFEIVARVRVSKDGQPLPVLDEPRDDLAKQFRSERELATSPRMRTDRLVVHASDDKSKRPARRLAQSTRLLSARGVEIDMRVIVRNGAHLDLLRSRHREITAHLAIIGFGLATFSFPLALGLLAIAGAADMYSAVFRGTIVQLATPDELRGRLSAMHLMVVTGGPRIGDLEATAVAAAVSAPFSAWSGGLLCVLGVFLVAWRFPQLAAYDGQAAVAHAGPDPPPAPAAA